MGMEPSRLMDPEKVGRLFVTEYTVTLLIGAFGATKH